MPPALVAIWQRTRIYLISPVRVLNKQEEIRGERRGGASALIGSELISVTPISDLPASLSLSIIQTSETEWPSVRRGGQHARKTNTPTANFCTLFIYPFAACLCLKYKGQNGQE